MSDLGLVAAFLGGVLSLLSRCSALLVPSFFAYAFSRPTQLLGRTAVFYLGLCLTLVPLGIGSSLVSSLFYGQRETLILVAGWTIIALGVGQLLGGGFRLPVVTGLQARLSGRVGAGGGWLPVLGLGAVYGLAGFCAGPVLGSVLTIAATSDDPWVGGGLLAVYALGMAAPMFVLALLWDRFDLGRRGWLRGRPVRVGRLRLHSTSLVSGVLFVVIGALFLRYDGTAALTGALGLADTTDLEFGVQAWVLGLGSRATDLLVLLALAGVVGALTVVRLSRWRRHRVRTERPTSRPSRT